MSDEQNDLSISKHSRSVFLLADPLNLEDKVEQKIPPPTHYLHHTMKHMAGLSWGEWDMAGMFSGWKRNVTVP